MFVSIHEWISIEKQLKIFEYFFVGWVWLLIFTKTKVMIIKSKKITCANLMYGNNNLEELYAYKYLKIDLRH